MTPKVGVVWLHPRRLKRGRSVAQTNADVISEKLTEVFIERVDRDSLADDLSRRETAQIYRELAMAFTERASELEQEADQNDE